MEPERNIEKLLRAYAKKRRGHAGEPLQLPSAARRQLQDEAARRAPGPEVHESLSLWQLFWRQWALLTGFALVIFLGAALLLPVLSGANRKAQSLGTVNNLKQIGAAAQMAAEGNHGQLPATLDALTNGFLPPKALTDPATGRPFVYVAAGKNLKSLPGNAVLAFSPEDKKGRAVLFADGRVEYANAARFAGLTHRTSSQLALADESRRRQLEQTRAVTRVPTEKTAPSPQTPSRPNSMEELERSQAAAPGVHAGSFGKAAASQSEIAAAEQPKAAMPPPAPSGIGALGAATNQANLAAAVPEANPVASPPPALPVQALVGRQPATEELFYRNTLAPASADRTALSPPASRMRPGVSELKTFSGKAPAPARSAPVLAHFEVQQSGDSIRIVDADGSVYKGALRPANRAAQSPPVLEAIPRAPTTQTAQITRMVNQAAQRQTAQNFSFRVAGMNRTLQQTVVFNGDLIAMSNAPPGAQQFSNAAGGAGVAGQLQQAAVQTQQLLLSNSRIAGTAVIGGTNEIQINATPLAR